MDQRPAKDGRRIRTLLAMACDGGGPSQTCLNIMNGAHRAGHQVDVFANRSRVPRQDVPMVLSLPGLLLAKLPYRRVMGLASRRLEQQFLHRIEPGDVAYLWPAASVDVHRKLHAKGVPVVLEAINTRMASARKILDAAYEAFGVAPSHGITDQRIAEEEEKYGYCRAVFAPNRHVESALVGSPLEHRVLPSSYGVHVKMASPPRDYPQKDNLTVMFCGYACVRKGAHFLLDAWAKMPAGHKLQIVGNIEPVIAERYADILASDRVEVVGFVDNVHDYFANADVFVMPSLEEGGPQVTYEAAIHGAAIIASPMGASRLGDTEGTMLIVEPSEAEAFEAALLDVLGSVELRRSLGETARTEVNQFDWDRVGARRAEQIQNLALN